MERDERDEPAVSLMHLSWIAQYYSQHSDPLPVEVRMLISGLNWRVFAVENALKRIQARSRPNSLALISLTAYSGDGSHC